ncbi:hypothetical protein [Hymenobacter negativus]|uniref:Uncharacterized protein n=1 Tax=Hymenobacter negativus TaxID=2795026 RepID=A0ABS3QPI0_9BACT|nr:hypothetical protein [Hymenobacter negativus]MBO2013151.1 hypothetical protein [Hymenobacter negativus]
MTHKSKWLLFSPLGLMVIGAGASMVHWAGSLKDQQAPTRQWLLAGTAALVVLNAGVSLFGQGVVERVLHEVRDKPRLPDQSE